MDNTEEPEDAPPALLVPAATAATSIGLPPAASKRYPITSSFLCVCVQPAGKAQAYGGLFMPPQYVTVTSRASGRYVMQKGYGCAAQVSAGFAGVVLCVLPSAGLPVCPRIDDAVFLILRLLSSFCLLVAAHPLLSSGR